MPMEDPKYVCIKITDIPEEFILEYRLAGIEDINGWIYFEICWGCYGLPQAGILANNHLRGRLEEESYYKAHSTPGLWQHKWRPVQFCLIVDNFGVEYVGKEHFNHLLTLLKKYHQVQTNMAGDTIAGINVQWDFLDRRVRIDMRTYINNLLLTFNWPKPRKPQLSSFIATPITYGKKTQLTPDEDRSALLSPKRLWRVQKIVWSLLYYTRAVDNKLLVAHNAIALRQSKATVHREQLVYTHWTMWPCIAMTAQSTKLATWYSVHMQTQATSTKPNPAAEPGHTSTSWR